MDSSKIGDLEKEGCCLKYLILESPLQIREGSLFPEPQLFLVQKEGFRKYDLCKVSSGPDFYMRSESSWQYQ